IIERIGEPPLVPKRLPQGHTFCQPRTRLVKIALTPGEPPHRIEGLCPRLRRRRSFVRPQGPLQPAPSFVEVSAQIPVPRQPAGRTQPDLTRGSLSPSAGASHTMAPFESGAKVTVLSIQPLQPFASLRTRESGLRSFRELEEELRMPPPRRRLL